MAKKFKIAGQNVGKKLSLKELRSLAETTDRDPGALRDLAKRKGIKIAPGAKKYVSPDSVPEADETYSAPSFTYTVTPGGSLDTEAGMTQEQAAAYLYESGLTNLRAQLEKEIQSISEAGALKRTELDVAARNYLADKQALTATEVEKIRGQNDINVQSIINAGLKDVETVRQEGGRDIARITGEFGVKQESERQRGQKDIAKIGSESAYRNALIGAFSF